MTTSTARARITAAGTGTPPDSYTQHELLRIFAVEDSRIRSLFLNSAIDRRHLTLPPADEDGRPRTESQGELLRKHVRSGIAMARDAVENCLKRSGAEPEHVRFLCCVSSTGFITPGFSALLIEELGIPHETGRLDVVGMGCNAGLNALSAVTAWSTAHPGETALMVCIEACSAAYAFDSSMRTAVVNSLFGDGAAAITVMADSGSPTGSPAVLKFSSKIIPQAIDAMRYDWDDDHGRFSFYLDPQVPYVVGAHAEAVLRNLLDGTGLCRSDIAHWVIHSGGKKVIDSVRVNLGLSRYDTRHTTAVLRDFGNVSSGAFLFAYERLLDEDIAQPGDHGVLMTMGPGATIEMALLQW
ncbi:3,5-dihydroxyphenylacetyl-CoA synthase DpgA [Streptomyces sp. NPDC006739]|uniref:3,5-dihydroxyphenylacetyl-CoA synthase DpgA n=1 Tax=Streptomyces sp. NPDC006739 TaxID=3364763 RepID=UPI0036924A4E